MSFDNTVAITIHRSRIKYILTKINLYVLLADLEK